MKVIAWYLPQFHEIEENNKWWGEGFTEWYNLKKSKPLFYGHNQPREPLDDNYYDLSKMESLRWQVDLANKYNIYGFCFYHYWFNGKLLLEKPMELLLQDKSLKINYCISWANEPWTRAWDGKNSEILIAQDYGEISDWENHFNYLVKFFEDERYIKVDNKPMLLIYKTQSIPKCTQMMEYFIERAKEINFDGIHFVETIRTENFDKRHLPIESRVEFEPARTMSHLKLRKWYNRFRRQIISCVNYTFKTQKLCNKVDNYVSFCNKSLNIKMKSEIPVYPGVFLGWDNTPRKKCNGTVFINSTPYNFEQYLRAKIQCYSQDVEYLFINAWNEWCEGTYLEPDNKYKFQYLEVIKKILKENK